MLLEQSTPEQLEFSRRPRPRAFVLVGAVFGFAAVLPWLGHGPMTLTRTLTSAALAGLATFLGRSGWGRSSRVRISLRDGVVEGPTTRRNLSEAEALTLCAVRTEEASGLDRYRAVLCFRDGAEITLLEDADPARVLRDVRGTLVACGLPVRPGWTLSAPAAAALVRGAPRVEPSVARWGPTRTFSVVRFASQLDVARSLLAGTTVIGLIVGYLMLARMGRGELTSDLSVILPTLFLGIGWTLGAAIATDRVEVEAGPLVSVSRRTLGRRWKRWQVRRDQLHGAWAVSPGRDTPQHVIVDTDAGLFAFRCSGEDAAAIARVLSE